MVMENAVIKTKAAVDKFCVINALVVVSHGCSVGDYSHLSLGLKIEGNVKIGSNVFLGINSSVNQKIKIESKSVIGSGSLIINNVINNSLEVGNPRNIIKVRSNENKVMTRPSWTPMHQLKMNCNYYKDQMINTNWLYERLVNVPSSPL